MKTLSTSLTVALLATLAGCVPPDVEPGTDPAADLGAGGESVARAQSGLVASTHYVLRNPDGNCMDVPNRSNDNGAQVSTWGCNDGLNQAFGFVFHDTSSPELLEGQEVQIIARHSGKCLDVEYGSAEAGARVLQWGCHDGANQRWYLWALPGGKLGLKSKQSGLCLVSAPSGGGLIQDDCDATPDARRVWGFTPTVVPAPPPAGTSITLFRDGGYAGPSITLAADVPDLRAYPGWNDAASSATLSPGGYVSVYQDINYGGACETIFLNTPDLYKRLVGNDSISSLRLGSHCRTVVLFEHGGYGGDSISFVGEISNLMNLGWNDRVSSMELSPGSAITLYQHVGYGGVCQNFTTSRGWLSDTNVGNDALSSLRFGENCGQRNIGVKNVGSNMTLSYRIKQGGAWGERSSDIDPGERVGTIFNDTRDIELEVSVDHGLVWALVCTKKLTTSGDFTMRVSGNWAAPSCDS
ncbi:MAG TPA: RICIN domain-containing protein [Polyangiaceae bacterium]|nr:RICIN domain-containing protein [Polyangiaceae bacterium]